MKTLLLPLALALLVGCGPAPEEPPAPTPAQTQAAGSDPGITPMTPTPMPNAPVAGSESLQGGGSAVGQIAKDRARSLGGGSSLDQMAPDGQ
ncbi:MAG: hypothetical protein M9921_01755 [Fimbriimonadaceae bacterium]|nr:hypothetical protein [Chthonomonadaceae bacterium]MCO5295561.1 hypothetical protein [Fimbriimonadaceae bacterium]